MIGVGLIGYGYWGPNLLRNFAEVPGFRVIVVSDLRPNRLALVHARYSSVKTTVHQDEVFSDPAVDVIAIATPVSTHMDLAMRAIKTGRHVWVEKPMTRTVEEAERLLEEAANRQRLVMVDHTFIYTGAVTKIKTLVDDGQLGRLYYYDSVRVNLGLFQHDVNVLWDLAVHDLAIMDYILRVQPVAVAAIGMAHVTGQPESMAYLTCFFETSLLAHFHVNWLAPVKIRRTLVGGDQKMIVYDDLEPSEKVKLYDKGVTIRNRQEGIYRMLVNYRTGDVWAPRLETAEALRVAAEHFLNCLQHGQQPLTNGQVGLRVVRLLEAANQSLTQRGRPIEICREKQWV